MEGFDRQVTVESCFSDEERDQLINAAETNIQNATVGGKITDPSIRRSQVHWLDKEKYSWAYQKVWKAILKVNNNNYDFSIKNLKAECK